MILFDNSSSIFFHHFLKFFDYLAIINLMFKFDSVQ